MKDDKPPDLGSLTLLVQLFGRETLDRLARAGFDDEAAIAGAGADHLALETGIALPLAQRIVAVVNETRVPGTPHRSPREPHEPRGGKTPQKRAGVKAPVPRIETIQSPADPDQADAFVDDVSLVTWMGFSSKTSSGRPFAVAEGIFDHTHREPPSPEEEREAAPGDRPVQGTPPTGPEPSSPTRGTPDPAPQRTLPGSFWSFGRRPDIGKKGDHDTARPPADLPDPSGTPGTPRRRNRHDH